MSETAISGHPHDKLKEVKAMGSAWSGDWEERIRKFARERGHPNIWDFLQAHPAISLREIANMIGDAAPVQIERIATEHCATNRLMPELLRDLVSRDIVQHLPRGWGTEDDFNHVMATAGGSGLPAPYSELLLGKYLLRIAPPPSGWLPKSGEDEILRAAYAYSLAEISPEKRKIIELGEIEKRPGSIYWAVVGPIWKSISIYDGSEVFLNQFAAARREAGHLFAAHWCQSEVRNGGFHQFFINPTGVLAPEALEGFLAIGMPTCADLIRRAMQFFESKYPREQHVRREMLDEIPGKTRDEWDPFKNLDKPFYEALRNENGGFALAADEYARKIV